MMLQMLKAKIQELTVTESNVAYPGSICLPETLLEASGIRQFELVHVNNKTTGSRIMTYAVAGKRPGFVSLNGAASKHFRKGDIIHVLAFVHIAEEEAAGFCPTLVLADKDNQVLSVKPYSFD